MYSLFRSSFMLRRCPKNFNFSRMVSQAPLRRSLGISSCMGLGLGLGISTLAFSEEAKELDVHWTRWESALLSSTDRKKINKRVTKLAPKRDIFKNISYIIPLFKAKCDVSKECMSVDQFFRWLQYHINVNFTEAEKKVWLAAFDLASNDLINLNEFISVYVLIQTMEKKNLKKRDLFKWSKANFNAIDLDDSGYLDFDEVVYWIEFAIRAGYVENKDSKGNVLSAEELGDITLRKYDDNFDGKISFEEFRAMFSDLLTGHFSEWQDPTSPLRSSQ